MSNITSNAALSDAQSQNDISRIVRQYRELDLFFSRKNGTNDITKITVTDTVTDTVTVNVNDTVTINNAPTIEMVREYFDTRGYVEEFADKFFHYYDSLEWVNKKAMKSHRSGETPQSNGCQATTEFIT